MNGENKQISISKTLYKLLERKIAQKKFGTVDDYVEHLLLQLLQVEGSEDIDPEEEEEIKERLEKLGYL
jgi:Arc/MetJ-type ribon-helix-helix transcriptional regulator